MAPGGHQRRIMASGKAKEAGLVCRRRRWYFSLVVESGDADPIPSGPVMGVDVGENNLAATSTGKVWGGGELRHKRNGHLALCRRLESNGSQSARQKLRQVSDKEQQRVTHINHETNNAIVAGARRIGASRIVMEDLCHIRDRIQAGRRVRARLHGWAFRQLQTFVEYKARAAGIAVEYVDPAYTSQTCSKLWKYRRARQASFRVQNVWSPGARRRQCQSKPCLDWQRCPAAKGGRKHA